MSQNFIRQWFTEDKMDTLTFAYRGRNITLKCTGVDDRGNQYIDIPASVEMRLTLDTAGKRPKDYMYVLSVEGGTHTIASHYHLMEMLPIILRNAESRGIRLFEDITTKG